MSKLRLVPVTGKYCQCSVAGKTFEIWRQLNGVKELGTAIDYEDAVVLLQLQPPVVSLVPKIENGKFVSELKASDLAAIKEAQAVGQSRISNAFNNRASAPESSGMVSAQKEEIAILKETIELQKQQNEAYQKQLDEQKKQNDETQAQLKAVMAEVQKLSKKA